MQVRHVVAERHTRFAIPRSTFFFVVVEVLLAACGGSAGANTYYWNTSGNTATLGGNGAWTMPDAWFDSLSGTSVNWSDGNDAVFSGAPGTVTLNQAVTLGSTGDLGYAMQVQSTGYVISGGTINLQGAGGNPNSSGAGNDATDPVLFVSGSLTTNSVFSSPTIPPSTPANGWQPALYGNIYKSGVGMLTLTGTDQFRNGGNIYLSDGFMDVGPNAVGITQQSTGIVHNVIFNGGLTSYGVLQLQGNNNVTIGYAGNEGYGNNFSWQGGNGGFAAASGTLNVSASVPQFNTSAGYNRITFGSPTATGDVIFNIATYINLESNTSYATPANGGVADTLFVVGNSAAPNAYTELYGTIEDNGNGGAGDKNNSASGGMIIKNGSGTLLIGAGPTYPPFGFGPNSYSGGTIIRAGTLMVASDAPANGTAGALGNNSLPVQLGDPAPVVSGGVTAVASYNIASLSGTTTITDGLTNVPVVNGNQVLLIDQTNPFQDGVYTVNASGAWTPSAYIGANMPYGLRTWVQSGDNYGGRYIYLASTGTPAAQNGGVYTASTGTLGVPGTGVWQLDADGPANVNVALLTSGNQTIAKDINVVANSSTGTSTLGGAATQAVSSAFTGNITLNKNLVLTSSTTGANAVTFSGNILGSGSTWQITKTGTGTVLLTGSANGYSGGTVVSQGLLSFTYTGLNTIPASGSLVVQAGGYLGEGILLSSGMTYAPLSATTFLSQFADTSGSPGSSQGVIGFDVNPVGQINLSMFGSNVRLGTRTSITLDNTNTITLPSGSTTYRFGGGGGVITENANITAANSSVEMGTSGNLPPGTLVLGGTNAYFGGTNVIAGDLVYASSSARPTKGKISLSSGGYVGAAYEVSAATFLDGTGPLFRDGFNESTAEGVIGFEGGVDGPINLTGFNDVVRLGARSGTTVTIAASNTITPPGTTYRFGGGGGTIVVDAPLTDGATPYNVDVGTSGGLAAGTVELAGANTFTGTTTISAGVLLVGSSNGLGGPGASVNVQNGATLNLGTATPTLGVMQLTNGTVTGSGGSITASLFELQNGSITGVLAGTGNLSMSTTGTVTLNSLSTYTGRTTLSGGSLVVTSMANGGQPSTIGAATSNASNLVFDGGTLVYSNNTAASSDRLFTLTQNGGSIVVTQNGSLSLTGTGAIGLTGGGARQLTLFGQNTGSNLIAGSLGDAGPGQPTSLTIAGGVNWVMNGNPTSAQQITGGAAWVLAGSNTYTGPTNVGVGTLQIGNGGATGSIVSNVDLSNSAVLAFNRTGSLTYGGAIIGAGSVANNGLGLLTLTGSSNYSMGTTLSAGTTSTTGPSNLGTGLVTLGTSATLQLGGNTPYSLANALTLGDTTSCNLDVPNTAGVTLNGPFNGYGALQKTGKGLLTVGGPMAVSGGVTISAGTVQVGAGGSIGGSIVNNANLVFSRADNSTFTGNVSGSGAFVKTGAGVLALSSTQAMTGPIVISQGTLKLTSGAAPSGMSLWLNAQNGVLAASGSVYQWSDQSGFGNNATQTNQALAPTYGANAILGGAPVVTFNGTSSQLNVNLNFMTHGVPYTIFSIEGNTSNSGLGYILGSAGAQVYDNPADFPNRTLYYGYGQAGVADLGQYAQNDVDLIVPPTLNESFNILAGGLTATGHFISNSGTATVTNSNTQGISSFQGSQTIGVAGPDHAEYSNGKIINPPLYYQGDMAEILIFNFAMDSTQVSAVSNYLSNEWLGTALPQATNILPTTGVVTIDAGGSLDLSSADQTLAGIVNGPHGGGTITNSGSSDSTLTITGTADSTFTGVIQNGPTNQLILTQSSSATLYLGSINTYTGPTTISSGTISASNLANGGLPSSVGTGPNDAAHLVIDGGALRYTGAGSTTDRLMTIGVVNSSGTIDASGTGPLVFSNTGQVVFGSISGNSTLTLAGSSAAANTFMPQVTDSNYGPTILDKEGPGTWVLNSQQTFTGGVQVNGGRLVLGPNGSLDEVPITVAGGATFAVQTGGGTTSTTLFAGGSGGASVTLEAGAAFDMTDGTVGQFNLMQQPSFGAAGLILQGGTLKFDLGAHSADLLTLNNGSVSSTTGNTISITGVGSTLTPGDYPLIEAPLGGLGVDLSLSDTTVTAGATTYGVSLGHSTNTEEIVTVTGVIAASGGTWTNSGGGYWGTGSNWAGGNVPGGGTLYFTNSTSGTAAVTVGEHRAATNLVLGQMGSTANYDLQVGDNGSMLLSGSGGTASILVRSGRDSMEIPLTLAANLVVTPSAGTTLALNGDITQSGGAFSLKLAGPGELVLGGSNTFTGGATVAAGTLVLDTPDALSDDSNISIGTRLSLFGLASPANVAAPASAGAAVPEPSTAALCLGCAALGCVLARRARVRRRRRA